MPKIACEPWPSCQNHVISPNVAVERQDVQDDCLACEQQRAECPGEEQEGDERYEGEHEWEIAEHRVAVVLLDRTEPGHPDHTGVVRDGVLHRIDRRQCLVVQSGERSARR